MKLASLTMMDIGRVGAARDGNGDFIRKKGRGRPHKNLSRLSQGGEAAPENSYGMDQPNRADKALIWTSGNCLLNTFAYSS
jgi:hypothetical protein